MKALVIGASGKIGSALVKALRAGGHEAVGIARQELDLLAIPPDLYDRFGDADVVYLCAAKTRFIDCESESDAYRVNVDAPAELGRQFRNYAKLVYLSSEAVERALHTNYGMHKALAEANLRAVCSPIIARIGKVDSWSMDEVCGFLIGLAKAHPGVHRWSADPLPVQMRVAA